MRLRWLLVRLFRGFVRRHFLVECLEIAEFAVPAVFAAVALEIAVQHVALEFAVHFPGDQFSGSGQITKALKEFEEVRGVAVVLAEVLLPVVLVPVAGVGWVRHRAKVWGLACQLGLPCPFDAFDMLT